MSTPIHYRPRDRWVASGFNWRTFAVAGAMWFAIVAIAYVMARVLL